jgi:hypothetical protein
LEVFPTNWWQVGCTQRRAEWRVKRVFLDSSHGGQLPVAPGQWPVCRRWLRCTAELQQPCDKVREWLREQHCYF